MTPSIARVGLGVAAIALAVAGTLITAQPATASVKADTSCQRAGDESLFAHPWC